MKHISAIIFVIALSPGLFAQTVSGLLHTKLGMGAGTGSSPAFFYGAEEYANLRLKIPAGEYAAVYAAFNLIAAAGTSPAVLAASSGGTLGTGAFGENYAALMELERLYVQVSADTLGLSAGLLRIPFGYGLFWGPEDFLNPRNPLEPDARQRGILGMTASWFPAGDMKLLAFAAAPQDPAALSGGGSRFGLSWENHWSRASLQALYSFESPAAYSFPANPPFTMEADFPQGLHRAGLSVKAELETGLAAEIIYTLDPANFTGIDGLAASAGIDYSFFDGNLYVLAEYLYSGESSVSAQSAALPAGRSGNHYLYGAGTWKWSDFNSLTLGCAASLQDLSFTPLAYWEYEFVQGMSFSLRIQVPLDRESFGGGAAGEFGPVGSGSYIYGSAGLKVKF